MLNFEYRMRRSWRSVGFRISAVFSDLEGEFQLAAEFLAVGEVKLVFLDEELAVHFVSGVFDEQLIFVSGENDADGRIVTLRVFLGGKVAEIHVHLPDVVMLDFVDFQINENKTAQDAVVENEVHPVVGVVQSDTVLPADEGEAFTKFEKEWLKVVAEARFQIGFGDIMRLRDFQKLEDVGIAEQIGRLVDDLALRGELMDGLHVLAGGESQEERGFFLTLQLTNRPFFPDGLLFIKTTLQWIIDLQKLHDVRPTQKVRQRRTFWVSEVKLANADYIATTETLTMAQSEITAEASEQARAVVGPGFAALFKLDDVVADLPVSFGDLNIDGLRGSRLTDGVNMGNFSQ